jgi:hypothetical protein
LLGAARLQQMSCNVQRPRRGAARHAIAAAGPHRLSCGTAAARRSDCEAVEAEERMLRHCIVAVAAAKGGKARNR